MPLYLLGRRVEDLFPLAFLPENHALAVAIMSYNGGLDYGLLGDYDALPDIEVIADGIDASLRELLDAAAHARTRAPAGSGSSQWRGHRRGRWSNGQRSAQRRSEADPPVGGHAPEARTGGGHARQARQAAGTRWKRTRRVILITGGAARCLPFHLHTATVFVKWTT